MNYKIQKISKNILKIINTTNNNETQLEITNEPTGNCQLSSIKNFPQFLEFTKDTKDTKDIIEIIKNCYREAEKQPALALVYVPEKYTQQIEKIFNVTYKHTQKQITMLILILKLLRDN